MPGGTVVMFESVAVSHRELMASPDAVAARVAAFLDLGDVAAAMSACVAPGLYRERLTGRS